MIAEPIGETIVRGAAVVAVIAVGFATLVTPILTKVYGAPETETTWTRNGSYVEVKDDEKPFLGLRRLGDILITIYVALGMLGVIIAALYILGAVTQMLM